MSYVTKDEVKKYLGVNFTSGLDTFVDKVISATEKYVERYCGEDKFGKRVFVAPDPDVASTRYFNGNGDTRLYVGDLQEITSLVVDGVELVEDEDYMLYPLNPNDGEAYQWIELVQPVTRINTNSRLGSAPYIFEVGQANVEVEGKWYFTETPPDDVQLAVLKLVGGVIKENISDADVHEKKSESIGDYSVSYQDVSKIAHALKINDLLDPYKRKVKTGAVGMSQVD